MHRTQRRLVSFFFRSFLFLRLVPGQRLRRPRVRSSSCTVPVASTRRSRLLVAHFFSIPTCFPPLVRARTPRPERDCVPFFDLEPLFLPVVVLSRWHGHFHVHGRGFVRHRLEWMSWSDRIGFGLEDGSGWRDLGRRRPRGEFLLDGRRDANQEDGTTAPKTERSWHRGSFDSHACVNARICTLKGAGKRSRPRDARPWDPHGSNPSGSDRSPSSRHPSYLGDEQFKRGAKPHQWRGKGGHAGRQRKGQKERKVAEIEMGSMKESDEE